MSDIPLTDDLQIAEAIDSACDQFERDWIDGRTPRIEDVIAGSPGAVPDKLFRALLGVELELRLKRGDRLSSTDYQQRFPHWKQSIGQVFQEVRESGAINAQSENSDRSTISLAASITATSDSATARKENLPQPLEPLQSLGRFEIQKRLGAGAFGTVYQVRDPKLDRLVAIKVPNAEVLQTADDRQRFLREARAAANLSHPNICAVHEVGEQDGHDYIVMGFVDGKPLSELIPAGKITPKQAVICVRKLALAFQEAHDREIVHRDIKPSNIMVSRKGEPIVMDFGLARLHRPGDADITHSGQIMGSPAYMSPEQARGANEQIGPASDIYSLGVVLYELLCGKRPFSGTVTEVLGKILHVEAPAPSTVKPGIDAALESICMKAMAKSQGDRYASMKEFADAMGRYLKDQAVVATSPDTVSETTEDKEPESDLRYTLAALAEEHRWMARNAVKEAVREGARLSKPPWTVIGIVAAIAAMIAFSGIWFFIRKDTVTVVVQIPIDTSDPLLSFFLDNTAIGADELAAPVELNPGEHELVVNKDNKLFKRFLFNVGKGDSQPVVVQDVTPLDQIATAENPDRDVAEWVLSIGGKIHVERDNGETIGILAKNALPIDEFRLISIALSVDIANNWVTDDLVRLKTLKHLRGLGLQRHSGIDDRILMQLAEIKPLEELQFYGNLSITRNGLESLAKLPKLRNLEFSSRELTDADAAALAKLAELKFLVFHCPLVTDVGFSNLASLKKLSVLGFDAQSLTPAGLDALQDLPLTEVHVTGMTDAHLTRLAKQSSLTGIWVNNSAVTDIGLADLRTLTPLTILDLYNCPGIDGSGFEHLQELPALRMIMLHGTRTNDQGLFHLRRLSTLESIRLTDCPISDAGIQHLAGLPNLVGLDLSGTHVTDAGLLNIHLMQSLREVTLHRTVVTSVGREKLRVMLPACRVIPEDNTNPPSPADEANDLP